MMVRGGVPKMVLMAEFTGESGEKVRETLMRAYTDVRQFDVRLRTTKTKDDARKYWIMRRESFNLLRKHVRGRHTAPFIDDIIVRPEQLPKFLPALYDILAKSLRKITRRRECFFAGINLTFIFVIIPSVPCEPTKSFVKSNVFLSHTFHR